jgi:hypothetical protein
MNGVALRKKNVATVALGRSNWTPGVHLEQPHWDLEFFPVHSDEWHVATRRTASHPDDTSCLEFCCLIFVLKCGAANCAMQGREWAKERQMSVQVPDEPQRLSPCQCWTLIDKLWGPSTTWTERRNVAQGGIALRISPASRDRWSFRPCTSASGSPWAKFRSLENYPISVSTCFNYINPCGSVCIVCSAFCILLRLE